LELFFRLEKHAQRHVEPSLTRLRRIAIRIDEEQRGRGSPLGCRGAAHTPPAATPGGAIEQLVAVGADRVLRDAGHELRRPAIAQSIAIERVAATRSEERRVGKECRSRWSPY